MIAVRITHLVALLVCLGTGLASPATAQSVSLTSVRLGFSGEGRVGVWLPAAVTVTGVPNGTQVALRIESVDPAGNLCADTVAVGRAVAGDSLELNGVFRTGRLEGTLRLAVVDTDSGAVLAETQMSHRELDVAAEGTVVPVTAAAPNRMSFLRHETFCVLGSGNLTALDQLQSELYARMTAEDHPPLRVLKLDSLQQIPSDADALQSVDAIVLQQDFSLSATQSRCLQEWVWCGGHLIVSAGANCGDLIDSPVANWIIPEFDVDREPIRVRSLTLAAFQNYVPAARVLSVVGTSFPIARIRSPQVKLELSSIDGPLIARRGVGSGVISFVAVDLTQRPLSTWSSLPQLYEMLLFGKSLDSATRSARRSSRISTSGVNDLGTQLAWCVDAVPAKDRWSSWVVIAWMAVWTLIAGPADYLLVTHVLKRPHVTWLTFPAFVVLGCFVVYWSAPSTSETVLRDVQVLDAGESLDRTTIRLRSWLSLSSADTRRSDLQIVPGAVESDLAAGKKARISWYGRPEDVYGGLYRSGGAGLARLTYEHGGTDALSPQLLRGIPLPTGSSMAFEAGQVIETDAGALFRSELSVAGTGLLEGGFEHYLPVPVNDWIVVHGNRVYMPAPDATDEARSLPPRTRWSRQPGLVRASDLKSFLTGRRIVRDALSHERQNSQSQTLTTPYNPLAKNPFDVFLMASLCEAVGGSSYVGLRNDQLRHDDLSDSILLNYAVLFGAADLPLLVPEVDGNRVAATSSLTIVRFMLPVALRPDEPARNPEQDQASDLN